MLTTGEISKLINKASLPKIVTAIEEKQIPVNLLNFFVSSLIFLENSNLLNILLETPVFLNLLLEAELARSLRLSEAVKLAAQRGREAAAAKMFVICAEENLSDKDCMDLLVIASTKGMSTLAEILLANPKVYAAMLKQAEDDQKANGRNSASLPHAFCMAARQGNAKIVTLFLPNIIKIGSYNEYDFSRLINEAKEKGFAAVLDLLHGLPQVKALEVKKKFLKFAENKDITSIKSMIEAGFNDIDTMYSALRKAIELNDYQTFEYLLRSASLREYAIRLANQQSTDGALHGDRWAYRLGSNCIRDTAQHGRVKMLEKFIEIDASAVSNSGALNYAVHGDRVGNAMFDLLVAKTKFKVSRSMMYAITHLLHKGDNNTIEQIFAKFASDAITQEQINKVILEIVCAVIEDVVYYPNDAYKILPILQFPMVKTAIDADNDCEVLKQFIDCSRAFDRALLERMFNAYMESGKVKLEAKNKNVVLYLAIFNQLVWLVDALLTIPEVIESLNNNPDDFTKIAESRLRSASKDASPERIEQLKKLGETDARIKERQSDLANAQHIENQIHEAISVQAGVRAAKRLRARM